MKSTIIALTALFALASAMFAADVELKPSEPLLFCADMEKSIAFYEGKLGFNVQQRNEQDPTWARLQRGDCSLMLIVAPDGEGWESLWKDLKGKPKGNGNWLYVRVDNADKLHAELKAKKVTFSAGTADGPVDRPWGSREFLVIDPDGYVTVFTQPK